MTTDLNSVKVWVVENGKARPYEHTYPIINASNLKDGLFTMSDVYVGCGLAGLALFKRPNPHPLTLK